MKKRQKTKLGWNWRLDSIDTKAMEIEMDAERMRADDLVKQFKLEMGQQDGGAKTGSSIKKKQTKAKAKR